MWRVVIVTAWSLWMIGYALLIWRGFRDKVAAMPLVLLASQIVWEVYYGFIHQHPIPHRYFAQIAFGLDCLLYIQYWMYGHKSFAPSLPRWMARATLLFATAFSAALLVAMERDLNDQVGNYFSFIYCVIQGPAFCALLVRRGSLAGQNLYIAVFLMLGDVGYMIPFHWRAPRFSIMTVMDVGAVIMQAAYVVLVVHYCRTHQINPWALHPYPDPAPARLETAKEAAAV